ncbi:MAG: aminotransferase class I/II-fold pyridoxal phosphate-dependent enzyme [Holosporales bacterium]
MLISTFKLVEDLGPRELSAPHVLCASDTQTWSVAELLGLADAKDLERWQTMELGYNEIEGSLSLRTALVNALYSELKPEQVATFAGAEEAIFCTLAGLLQAEDHVIALTPCYQAMLEVPKLCGARLTCIELTPENQWRINLEAIEKAIQPNTRWVLINFPHNITGQIITPDELKALITVLDRHGIWLYSDEVYRLSGPHGTLWPQPACTLYHRAVSLGVLTKPFGLAGLRMGWVACQDPAMLQNITKMKHYLSICNSAPNEILAEIALKNHEKLLTRNNAIISDNLNAMDAFFARHAELFSWVRPQGGCVGFVHYQGPDSIDAFCDRVIQEAGILLVPATLYDYAKPYFRLGFGRADLPQVLRHFSAYLDPLDEYKTKAIRAA